MLICIYWSEIGFLLDNILCWCAIYFLLSIPIVAYVQIFSYWRCNLLMCNRTIIGSHSLLMCISTIIEVCSCLDARRYFFAYDYWLTSAQWQSYWMDVLLVCMSDFIKTPYCLCASKPLLMMSFAYVQRITYWLPCLLICILIFIELPNCLCANNMLSILSFACVQSFSCWVFLLLMCKSVFIETLVCLCARGVLSNARLAYVHNTYYWTISLAWVRMRNYWM